MNFIKPVAKGEPLTNTECIQGYALTVGTFKLTVSQVESMFTTSNERDLLERYMHKKVAKVATKLFPDKHELVRKKLYVKLCFPCRMVNKGFDAWNGFLN